MKYLKTIIFETILFITLTLIITILYYFNIINNNINNIFKVIIFIITFLFTGIYTSIFVNKKYYLQGIKISVINIILFLILSIIFRYDFNIKQLLYYILIIIIITFGSIIGPFIVKKKRS